MSKITLNSVSDLTQSSTAQTTINTNSSTVQTAFDNTLSRDGTSPNQMGASLDMNSNRIINLPTAISVSEPVTLAQMTGGLLPSGVTTVPISAPMQPVVGASTIIAADALLGMPTVSCKLYGAVGDGATDDTVHLQNWINAIQTSNAIGFLAPGIYKISSPLTAGVFATGQLIIYGAGINASIITLSSTIQDGFDITGGTTTRLDLRNFQVIGVNGATSGSLINCTGGINFLPNSILDNLYLVFGFIGISSTSISAGSVISNTTIACTNLGLNMSYFGDSSVTNCLIEMLPTGTGAFFVGDSGGTRIVSTKIFANSACVSWRQDAGDGDLIICGCSFESFTVAAVLITNSTGIAFGSVTITGNEFAGTGNAILINFPTSNCSLVSIVGNILVGTGAINFTGVTRFSVIGNTTAGSFIISSTCTSGMVSGNTINGAVTNNSSSTVFKDNVGYNPVGASNLTPGASPWTYTAGASPETLWVVASTTISNITVGGIGVLSITTPANTTVAIPLAPFGVAVITYTGTLFATKMIY